MGLISESQAQVQDVSGVADEFKLTMYCEKLCDLVDSMDSKKSKGVVKLAETIRSEGQQAINGELLEVDEKSGRINQISVSVWLFNQTKKVWGMLGYGKKTGRTPGRANYQVAQLLLALNPKEMKGKAVEHNSKLVETLCYIIALDEILDLIPVEVRTSKYGEPYESEIRFHNVKEQAEVNDIRF